MSGNKKNVAAVVTAMGQLLSIIIALVAAIKKRGADVGEVFCRLASEEGAAVLEKIAELMVSTAKPYLRLVSTKPLMIGAVDGSEVLADAADVFTGYVDPNLRGWKADERGSATKEASAQVYEIVEDATFAQMFGFLSPDMAKLCFTQAQIKAFVKTHRNWLRTDGYATFFLFKSHNHFFVARLNFGDDGWLKVSVGHFENGVVWFSGFRHRLVVPQLA
ncbi:MAG: hypothetical protein WC268_03675 [Patescibacteria group bacterium]